MNDDNTKDIPTDEPSEVVEMDLAELLDELTLEELDTFETLAGVPLSKMDQAGEAKLLRAMVTLFKQRQDPSFSSQDAGKVKMSEAMQLLGEAIPSSQD